MKVSPGQVLRGLPARGWNRHEEVAELVLSQPRLPQRRSLGNGDILVRNDSGADVDRFRVLAITGPVFNASDNLIEYKHQPVLKGDEPDSNSMPGLFCITQETIPDGVIGTARVSGISVVQVTKPGTVYPWPFVDLQSGSTLGKENWYGAAEVLTVESVGSDRWATVRLGNFQAPPYLAKAAAAISSGGSGNCDIYIDGSSEETITGHLSWMEGSNSVSSNDELAVQFFRDEGKWRIMNAEC